MERIQNGSMATPSGSFMTRIGHPSNPTLISDAPYFRHQHVPLVLRNWIPYGLQKYDLTLYNSYRGLTTGKIFQGALVWESYAAFRAAFTSEHGREVFRDVVNFTNVTAEAFYGRFDEGSLDDAMANLKLSGSRSGIEVQQESLESQMKHLNVSSSGSHNF